MNYILLENAHMFLRTKCIKITKVKLFQPLLWNFDLLDVLFRYAGFPVAMSLQSQNSSISSLIPSLYARTIVPPKNVIYHR